MVNAVEPTGEVRAVKPHELFFSTTDRRGVIDASNAVFTDLSRYSESELRGSPHNIIRHPLMPGGAFHLMWERLLDGRSMVAYVRNLAGDGAEYWVLATVTPLGNGFLSVRTGVGREDLRDLVEGVYAIARAAEAEQRAAGASKAEAAAHGAQVITEELAARGFASVDELMWELLPAEVAAYSKSYRPAASPAPAGGRVGPLLAACGEVDAELTTLEDVLAEYLDVADAIAEAEAAIAPGIERIAQATHGATQVAQEAGAEAQVLVTTAKAAQAVADGALAQLQPLPAELAHVRALVRQTRATVALGRLHNDMIAAFGNEVLEGASADRLVHSALLAQAMGQTAAEVDDAVGRVSAAMGEIGPKVAAAGNVLAEIQKLLAQWRNMAARLHVGQGVEDAMKPVTAQADAGAAQMSQMIALSRRCNQLAKAPDCAPLRASVAAIAAAAG